MGGLIFWPGPMEGVMTPAFIRAASKLNLTERWMTPFLRISNNVPRERIFREFLSPFLESGLPVVLQLMGTDFRCLAKAAEMAQHFPIAGINFNCGCPSKRVVSSGAGGGALRNLPRTFEIVSALREAVETLPFSVKLRTGWECSDEQEEIIPELCRRGADMLFVHFRTVKELYLPAPGRRERLMKSIALAGKVPVVVNGDFNTPADFEEAEEMGAAGVMTARGWVRDPALFLPGGGDLRQELLREIRCQGVPVSKTLEISRMMGLF